MKRKTVVFIVSCIILALSVNAGAGTHPGENMDRTPRILV